MDEAYPNYNGTIKTTSSYHLLCTNIFQLQISILPLNQTIQSQLYTWLKLEEIQPGKGYWKMNAIHLDQSINNEISSEAIDQNIKEYNDIKQ